MRSPETGNAPTPRTTKDNDDGLLIAADPYRGTLSPRQLAAGIQAANDNARRLLADAESLYGVGSWPSACALAILSMEESAKEEILRGLAVTPDQARALWQAFRSHTSKSGFAAVTWARNTEHPLTLLLLVLLGGIGVIGSGIERLKWRALYVDCLDDDGPVWWRHDGFSADDAKGMVETARLMAHGRLVSTEEIEILIRHVAPVAGGSLREQEVAQARYLKQVLDRGLRPHERWMDTILDRTGDSK